MIGVGTAPPRSRKSPLMDTFRQSKSRPGIERQLLSEGVALNFHLAPSEALKGVSHIHNRMSSVRRNVRQKTFYPTASNRLRMLD